jgi:hypothetical protein
MSTLFYPLFLIVWIAYTVHWLSIAQPVSRKIRLQIVFDSLCMVLIGALATFGLIFCVSKLTGLVWLSPSLVYLIGTVVISRIFSMWKPAAVREKLTQTIATQQKQIEA